MFDQNVAKASLLKIQYDKDIWGMASMIEGGYVFTVAHCLPKSARLRFNFESISAKVCTFDGKREAKAITYAVDVCSDLAVLTESSLDGERLPPADSKAFKEVFQHGRPAKVAKTTEARSTPIRIFTHEGNWLTGKLSPAATEFDLRVLVTLDEEARVVGGTSGAPIFNNVGEIIGIVSASPEVMESAADQFMANIVEAVSIPGALPHGLFQDLCV